MDSNDMTLTICKTCKRTLERYRGGRRPNGKDTVFTNKEGKEWSGLKCPQCHLDTTKNTQYLKRKG